MLSGLCLGDLHFEKFKFCSYEKSVSFTLASIENAQRTAIENNITNIFQMGDIFDNPFPKQKTLELFISQILKYPKLKWWFILGNHDISDNETHSLKLLEYIQSIGGVLNMKIQSAPSIEKIDGVDCFFAPFPVCDRPEHDRQLLCFGHFSVNGFVNESGRKIKNHINPKELKRDFWFLGHEHKYQAKDNIVFVGTPHQMNFGEKLPKGVVIFHASYSNTNLEVDYTFIKLKPKIKFKTLIVNSKSDLKKIKKRIYYRVFDNSKDTTSGWSKDYPNVIQYKVNKENAVQELKVRKLIIDPLKHLKTFLKTQTKLPKSRIRAAIKIVEDQKSKV
jgi:DNA repair exonuclease SbcCD nuclease subunit